MLFSSPIFFAFFAVYFILHVLTPRSLRIWLIIAGSTFFYGYWNPAYVVLPLFLTVIGFFGAHWLDKTEDEKARKLRLFATIFLILCPLLFFKYTNFVINDVITPLISWLLPQAEPFSTGLLLPLGISFITFTLISYVVDVYKAKFTAEKSLKWLLGYILYFPQLIAGPILRPSELLPQLKRAQLLKRKSAIAGFIIFTAGLLKKTVFADQLAAFVDPIYAAPAVHNVYDLWLAVYGFSIQIYCDFSGYTDMAIGLALILGVKLPQNFRQPYGAASVAEFWRKWHITLSNWLRDYIYIPLGGSRTETKLQTVSNVMITMFIGGLWHGANWTFALWGVLHGALISCAYLPQKVQAVLIKIPCFVKVFVIFHVVSLLWVLFRSPDFTTAREIYSGLLHMPIASMFQYVSEHMFIVMLIVVMLALHRWDDVRRLRLLARKVKFIYLWPVILLVWILAITMSAGNSAQFIYFDF